METRTVDPESRNHHTQDMRASETLTKKRIGLRDVINFTAMFLIAFIAFPHISDEIFTPKIVIDTAWMRDNEVCNSSFCSKIDEDLKLKFKIDLTRIIIAAKSSKSTYDVVTDPMNINFFFRYILIGTDQIAAISRKLLKIDTHWNVNLRLVSDKCTISGELYLDNGIDRPTPLALPIVTNSDLYKAVFNAAEKSLEMLDPYIYIAYLDRIDPAAAIALAEAALKTNELTPNLKARYLTELGNINLYFLKPERRDEAERRFREAIHADPNHAVAYNGLGNALLKAGNKDPDEIERLYRTAISHDKKYEKPHWGLGNLAMVRRPKDMAAARSHYTDALRINPRFAPAHNSLAIIDRLEGNHAEAIKKHKIAINLDEFNSAFYMDILKSYDEAIRRNGKDAKQSDLAEAQAKYKQTLDELDTHKRRHIQPDSFILDPNCTL